MKEEAHHHDTVMTLVRFSLSFSVMVVGERTTMNLERDFLDYFMCYPSSPAPTSCSLHVIFGSKRNEKKIFFFSSSFWPVQDTHTPRLRKKKKKRMKLGRIPFFFFGGVLLLL